MGEITETVRISKLLELSAKTAMTLEQIIKNEITDWQNSSGRSLMQEATRYYRNDNDIYNKKREYIGEGGEKAVDNNLANNKLAHNFYRKLVDQKLGYLLSKPFSIQTDNEKYSELLQNVFDNSFMRILKNIGKEAINKGISWLMIYFENDKMCFKKIPSEQIIPLWKDNAHTELDSLIRVYEVEAYEGTTKKTITKVEYWDNSGVKKYVASANGGALVPDVEQGIEHSHFTILQNETATPMNWDRIPFIPFKYNDEEIPFIKFVKGLIDNYDKVVSGNADNLDDLVNFIYVLIGYDGTDLGEFRRNLSTYRAVKISEGGNLELKNVDIDIAAFEKQIEVLRKNIYEFGRGVDSQSEKFGNQSGIALKFLYADLDLDCNIIETEFKASFEQLVWFINQYFMMAGLGDYTKERIDIIFNRDVMINETEAIQNCLASNGVISQETILANHPFVTDVKQELDRIEKEKREHEGVAKVIIEGDNNAS